MRWDPVCGLCGKTFDPFAYLYHERTGPRSRGPLAEYLFAPRAGTCQEESHYPG